MSDTLVNAIFTPVGVIGGVIAIAIVVVTLLQRRWIVDWYTYALVVLFGPGCFVPLWHWPNPVALTLTISVAAIGVAIGAIVSRSFHEQRPPEMA